MQGMDKKYDGHAWLKVTIANIKNNFGLGFRKARWLGHLHCVKTNYNNLVCFGVWNEIAWVKESAQVSLKGQVLLGPPSLSFAYKFCCSQVKPCKG
jgi:hypothetical protein